MDVSYRGVFEPLARDAAFRAGNPADAPDRPPGPERSRFYEERVAPFWNRARALLDLSHRTDLLAMDDAIDGLAGVLWEFLVELGMPVRSEYSRRLAADSPWATRRCPRLC